jgi:hypothetical protein
MKDWVKSVIGEAIEPPPDSPPVPPAPVEPEAEESTVTSQAGVKALLMAWRSGDKVGVAHHVLDGLDSYQQFTDLVYAIGAEDAQELGRLMDEITSQSEQQPAQQQQNVYNQQ